MINARTKGAQGEREFCAWLKDVLEFDELPVRNLEQVRSGGADVTCIDPFMFEVKRCEKLDVKSWWIQVVTASKSEPGSVPIVAFRQNRKRWEFLIPSTFIGLKYGFIRIDEQRFAEWIQIFYGKYKENTTRVA